MTRLKGVHRNNSQYQRKWYVKNATKHKARAAARRGEASARNQKRAWEYLLAHPCLCGQADPRVLTFDHDDPAKKDRDVSDMLLQDFSWRRIFEEIQKCTVRCSNCHMKRTGEQRKDWKWRRWQQNLFFESHGAARTAAVRKEENLMPCSHVKFPDGTTAIVKHGARRLPRCKFCPRSHDAAPATLLCDAVIGKTLGGDPITCDAPVCAKCARHVGPDKDFCPKHSG